MQQYRLDVLKPPSEQLRARRERHFSTDKEAIEWADAFFNDLASTEPLDRYVLYRGDHVVIERRI